MEEKTLDDTPTGYCGLKPADLYWVEKSRGYHEHQIVRHCTLYTVHSVYYAMLGITVSGVFCTQCVIVF